MKKRKRKKPIHQAAEGFLDAKGAAAFLHVSLRTIRNWTYRKIIPHYRLSHFRYFKRSDLVDVIEGNRVGPKQK